MEDIYELHGLLIILYVDKFTSYMCCVKAEIRMDDMIKVSWSYCLYTENAIQ